MTDKDPRECKYAYEIMRDLCCDLTQGGRPCKMWKHGWNCSKFTLKHAEK